MTFLRVEFLSKIGKNSMATPLRNGYEGAFYHVTSRGNERRRKRSGHLFQGRYRAILIERDRYLLELSRYIHLNPVRAGVVVKPEDYHHSSYGAFITRREEDLVSRDLIWEMISEGERESIGR